MTAGFLGRVMNVEQGLVHTVYGLTVKPGVVVRDYLAGSTVRYTHPAGYLLISFAVFAVTAQLFGGGTVGGSENRLFVALLVPFVALVSRILFWRARFNYAEHLIVVMYAIGHIALFLALLQLAVPLTGQSMMRLIGIGALAVATGYFAWAYSRVFAARPFLAAAGALASLILGGALWLTALMMLLNVLRA
jgi:hypothetical protein